MRLIKRAGLALFVMICTFAPGAPGVNAADLATVRVGVLQFGTVSWELEVMQKAGFAEREGIRLEIVPLALKDATNVAIQGDAVDIIVNDWIWVARQRADGRDFTFVPYSLAVGGLMVHPDSGIATLADLRGKRLGVAGGPLDKSWLLLRAYSQRNLGEDAESLLRADFVAPPLLNQLILRGELQGALNYWHYGARLRGAGLREILSMKQILAGLGIEGELPLVGWVFREGWADKNERAIGGFLRASAAAKVHMRTSDAVWKQLRPMMRVDDDATFHALRDGFRAGIPAADMVSAEQVARQAFDVLSATGGKELVGNASTIAAGTFWKGGSAR